MDKNDVIIALSISFLLFLMGIQLLRGKWLFLIAGYNTMSKEEKSKVNGEFLGKTVGSCLILVTVLILVMILYPKLAVVAVILIVLLVFTMIIYLNTSKKRNSKES